MKKVVLGIISRINKKGKKEYLLINTTKDFGEFTGFYYPPGGHQKKGETEKQTLIREIREELSLTVEPVKKIVETPGDVKEEKDSWWFCKILEGKPKMKIGEIANFGYFTHGQIKKMKIWPATSKFFKKYLL
ncbi:MAG TPA: NUDIX hydrolase [Candidatus Bathyarchaeia archaeon]|nr:NUDIX hydrolase [Candidatus Bathyarchaeia archaeon]